MFKKPNRNFRQRGGVSSSSDSDGITVLSDPEPEQRPDAPQPAEEPSRARCKRRPKHNNNNNAADKVALSFADEEEEDVSEVFQVRKSQHSRRIARKLRHQRLVRQEGGASCGGVGVVDQAERHSNGAEEVPDAPHNGRPQQSGEKQPVGDSNPGPSKLSPDRADSQPRILSGRDAEFADYRSSDDDQNCRQGEPLALEHRPTYSIRRALKDGVIPDASMIHAVRKRREQARLTAEPNFVPLSEPSLRDGSGGEEEGGQRVDLSAGDTVEQQRRQRQLQYDLAREQDEGGQCTEISTWESQQLMKAISGSQRGESALASGLLRMKSADCSPSSAAADGADPAGHSSALSAGVSLLPARKQRPLAELAPDKVRQRLADKLAELRASRDDLRRRLDGTLDQLVTLQHSVLQVDRVTPLAATRFHYYQDIRGYVTDMIECFNEKVPLIDALSERFVAVLEQRCRYLSQRRHEDTRDQRRQLETSDGTLLRHSSLTAASEVELTAAEVERRQRRTAEREGRRMRRRRQRELVASLADAERQRADGERHVHADGMSSDDELPAAVLDKLERDTDGIKSDAEAVFADVHEEFSTLDGVCRHFSEWRCMDPKAYKQAFVSFSLPQALAPIVRLATICWNPVLSPVRAPIHSLSEECFEQSAWYLSLAGYCLTAGGDEGVPRETQAALSADPDRLLVPRVAELCLLPRLLQLVRRCWDPLSVTEAQRLAAAVQGLHRQFVTLSARREHAEQVLGAVTDRYVSFTKHELYIPRYPAHTLRSRTSPATVFFLRQLHAGIKLLGSASCWHGVLDDSCLQQLCLIEILANQLMVALSLIPEHDEALSKCTLIVDVLPTAWFSDSCPQQMSMFVSYLSILASQAFKSGTSTKILNGIADLLLRIKAAAAYAKVLDYVEQRGVV